jgi:hypothetical protein
MPGGSVTKIGRTCKKWTYIARKQNIHLTKKQHISQNFTVQYKCKEQNIGYNKLNTRHKTQKNNSIHRNNKTRKQGKSYCRELNPGRQGCSSTLAYELSRPCVRFWAKFIWPMVSPLNGNKHSFTVTGKKFVDILSDCSLLKEGCVHGVVCR